jgi:hypothetical protein
MGALTDVLRRAARGMDERATYETQVMHNAEGRRGAQREARLLREQAAAAERRGE